MASLQGDCSVMKKIGIVCVLFLFSGCASATQYVPFPNQKNVIDDPSKGRVYVFRPTRFGFAVPMEIDDNGKTIGKTLGHTYLSWEREPGHVNLIGKAETDESLPISVKPGERIYIKQSVEMGIIMARNSLSPIDEKTAEKYLADLKPPKVKIKK
jgi:hypothetical protein